MCVIIRCTVLPLTMAASFTYDYTQPPVLPLPPQVSLSPPSEPLGASLPAPSGSAVFGAPPASPPRAAGGGGHAVSQFYDGDTPERVRAMARVKPALHAAVSGDRSNGGANPALPPATPCGGVGGGVVAGVGGGSLSWSSHRPSPVGSHPRLEVPPSPPPALPAPPPGALRAPPAAPPPPPVLVFENPAYEGGVAQAVAPAPPNDGWIASRAAVRARTSSGVGGRAAPARDDDDSLASQEGVDARDTAGASAAAVNALLSQVRSELHRVLVQTLSVVSVGAPALTGLGGHHPPPPTETGGGGGGAPGSRWGGHVAEWGGESLTAVGDGAPPRLHGDGAATARDVGGGHDLSSPLVPPREMGDPRVAVVDDLLPVGAVSSSESDAVPPAGAGGDVPFAGELEIALGGGVAVSPGSPLPHAPDDVGVPDPVLFREPSPTPPPPPARGVVAPSPAPPSVPRALPLPPRGSGGGAQSDLRAWLRPPAHPPGPAWMARSRSGRVVVVEGEGGVQGAGDEAGASSGVRRR